MKEVIIVAIWDKGKDALTRSILVDMKTEPVKVNGKKPNKMIIPESLKDGKLKRKVKNMGSYNCVMIEAKGK